MTNIRYTEEEIVRSGRDIYERDVREEVEPEHDGDFVVVDVSSDAGDYEVAVDGITAARRLRERHPQAVFCFLRVGQPTAYRIGAGPHRERPAEPR